MDCRHAEESISARLDGALVPAAAASLEAHLAGCPACAALAQQVALLPKQISEQAEHYRAPDHLRKRLLLDLERSQQALPGRTTGASSRAGALQPAGQPWRWLSGAAAAFGALALAASLSLYLALPPAGDALQQEVVASHYRSLMASHLSDVISTDQHTVKPWFTGKLDFAPRVVDLAAQGFVLAGGRLDYVDQHAAAALVYRHRQHVMNLFVWPSPGPDQASAPGSRQGFQTLHWRRDGMAYWLVSDVAAPDLEQFQRLWVQAAD